MPAHIPMRQRIEGLSVPVPESGCWLWLGSIDQCGYGKMGARNGETLAHRNSYREFVGPIPQGLEIDHLCKVRCCVNPLHLQVVTHQQNVARGNYATTPNHRNRRKTQCKRGHELAGENLKIVIVKGKQVRQCWICDKVRRYAHHQRYYARNKNDPEHRRKAAQRQAQYRARRRMGALMQLAWGISVVEILRGGRA